MLKLTESQKGYVAGIIDGEGSISIHKDSRGNWYTPRIHVGNTDEKMIDYLLILLGGNKHNLKERYYNNKLLKPQYAWYTTNTIEIIEILINISVYLITKKSKALLMVQFCLDKAKRKNKWSHYDGESYYLRMKELNK